jgi:hypothetical protein
MKTSQLAGSRKIKGCFFSGYHASRPGSVSHWQAAIPNENGLNGSESRLWVQVAIIWRAAAKAAMPVL